MHYYIDGYNLLFRTLKTGDDLKNQRKQVTLDLENKFSVLNIDATLVFDSHYQEDDSVRSHFKCLEIIFTALGQTADDFILQELKESKNPSQHTVVTSDKKLALHCRLRLAKTESIDEFLAWLNKRYKNKLKEKKEQLQPLKEPSKDSLQRLLLKPQTSSQAPKIPTPDKGSFEFYLESFEANSKLIIEEENLKSELKASKKNISNKGSSKKPAKQKKSISEEESMLSDTDRWVKAFQKE